MKKNKKSIGSEFNLYLESLTEQEQNKIKIFFDELKNHLLLSKNDIRLIKLDFEKAWLYYLSKGLTIDEIMSRLDLINLGGFYARPSSLWLSMDDVAKMYTLFMKRDAMGMFRISAYLKDNIVPEILQMALLFTIKRFPSFAVTLKKGLFWNYLDSQKKRFKIELEHNIPCVPINVSISGSQTFRVIYFENRISVELFHGMTDGTGGLTFLKALVKEYLILLGKNIPTTDFVFEVNDIPEIEEYENAFRKIKLNGKKDGLLNKSALQLGGKLTNKKPSRIIHFKMNTTDLIKVVKSYNATVTSFMISLLMMAAKGSTDEIKGDLSICFPINLRKTFPTKTIRNFSVFSQVRLPIEKVTSIKDIIEIVSTELTNNTTKESLIDILTSTVGITQKIGIIPLVFKQPIVKLGYNLLGDNQFTTNISNLGIVELPKEMADEILSMDFVLGTAITNRAITSLITINNITTLSISKLTKDPSFEEEIYLLLNKEGISVEVEGSEEYEY